jgi:hypothetical protein
VTVGGQKEYLEIPLQQATQNPVMPACGAGFACQPLDTGPMANPQTYLDNQLWVIAAAQGSGPYLATVTSQFTGNWIFDHDPLPGDSEYLSWPGIGKDVHQVSVEPIAPFSNPTGAYPDQAMILTPEPGGTWEFSP